MKPFVLVALFLPLTTLACEFNLWEWAYPEGNTEAAESDLLDAEEAANNGDYDLAYEYYTNAIAAAGEPLSSFDDSTKGQFYEQRVLLARAHSGRATALIQDHYPLQTIIDGVTAFLGTGGGTCGADRGANLIEIMYSTEFVDGQLLTVETNDRYTRAEAALKAVLPTELRNREGQPLFELDDPSTTKLNLDGNPVYIENRISITDDLAKAADYSKDIGDFNDIGANDGVQFAGAAIHHTLNYAMGMLLATTSMLFDLNHNFDYWDHSDCAAASCLDEGDIITIALTATGDSCDDLITIDQTFIDSIQGGIGGPSGTAADDQGESIVNIGDVPVYEGLATLFGDNSLETDDGTVAIDDLAKAEDALASIELLLEDAGNATEFAARLDIIIDDVVSRYEDILVDIIGLSEFQYTDPDTGEVILSPAVTGSEPLYSSLITEVDLAYQEVINIDPVYNLSRTDAGGDWTTLFNIKRILTGAKAIQSLLVMYKMMAVAVVDFYDTVNGSLADAATAMQDPAELLEALESGEFTEDEIQELYDFLSSDECETFGCDSLFPDNQSAANEDLTYDDNIDPGQQNTIESALCALEQPLKPEGCP